MALIIATQDGHEVRVDALRDSRELKLTIGEPGVELVGAVTLSSRLTLEEAERLASALHMAVEVMR